MRLGTVATKSERQEVGDAKRAPESTICQGCPRAARQDNHPCGTHAALHRDQEAGVRPIRASGKRVNNRISGRLDSVRFPRERTSAAVSAGLCVTIAREVLRSCSSFDLQEPATWCRGIDQISGPRN
jgi:hypothetical protein